MKITEIKLSDKDMLNLIKCLVYNNYFNNFQKIPFEQPTFYNYELPIDSEIVELYFNEANKCWNNKSLKKDFPYISLISDNSKGELKVYINNISENNIINALDLTPKTDFIVREFDNDNKKFVYEFFNS